MHSVYKVEWNKENTELKRYLGKPVCAWSSKNLIAFTTGYLESSNDRNVQGVEVHIFHPDYPWEVFHLDTRHENIIMDLMWNRNGSRLITVDSAGKCKVWEMVDSFINKWKKIREVFTGGRVACVKWLDVGPRYLYDLQPQSRYSDFSDKFPSKFSKPPLTNLMGQGRDGFIAVTGTASIFVVPFAQSTHDQQLSLTSSKFYVDKADMIFTDDGKICLAVSTERRIIEIFIIALKDAHNKIELSVEQLPCLVPHSMSDEHYSSFKIGHVQFVNRSAGDHLLIVTESPSGTCLKYFQRKTESVALWPKIKRKVQSTQQLNQVLNWVCMSSFECYDQLSSIGLSHLPAVGHDGPSAENIIFPAVVVATHSNKLYFLSSRGLMQIFETNITIGKKHETLAKVIFSPCDLCLLAVTSKGNVFVLLSQKLDGISDRIRIRTVANMFEYCIVSGYPAWDVALLSSFYGNNFAEECLLTLKHDFSDQNLILQDQLEASFVQVSASLYKGMKGAYFGALESYYSILLKAVYCYLQSIFNSSSDKDSQLANKVHNLCKKHVEIDIPKVIQSFDIKDLSANVSLLLTNQFLIQWVTDYCIHLVIMVINLDPKGVSDHAPIAINPSLLNTVREIILLLYMWGQAVPASQPHFATMGSPLDMLAQLFKVITKLYVKASQGEIGRDSISLEEVPFLSVQVHRRTLHHDPSGGVLNQNHSFNKGFDIYEFLDDLDIVERSKDACQPHPLIPDVSHSNGIGEFMYDGIYFMTFNIFKEESVKQCCHCRCLTLHKESSSRSLPQDWKQRWNRSCFCGGLWKLLVVPSNKLRNSETVSINIDP